MNTSTVSNSNYPEDRYKYYNNSSECIEPAETNLNTVSVEHNNSKVIQDNSIQPQTTVVDTLSPAGTDISANTLSLAKTIKMKTEKFKQDHYDEAFELKGTNQKRPNIKNYLQVAEKLQKKDIEVDEKFLRANSTDCSGFIKMLYEKSGMSLQPKMQAEEKKLMDTYGSKSERFRELDRGAELLRRASEPVDPDNVKPGDLIFFKEVKTLKKDRQNGAPPELQLTDYATHIGIVSEITSDKNGRQISFIHKSTNGGVVESKLDSPARAGHRINYSDLNPTFGRIE